MDPTLIQNLLYALALALVGLISFALRSLIEVGIAYLRSKLSQSQFDMLYGFAATCVRSLEQSPVFSQLEGEKKKELVILQLTKFAAEKNIPLTRELCDQIIEASVQVMNSEMSKLDFSSFVGGDPGAIVGSVN